MQIFITLCFKIFISLGIAKYLLKLIFAKKIKIINFINKKMIII
jgi:hypothetical protein